MSFESGLQITGAIFQTIGVSSKVTSDIRQAKKNAALAEEDAKISRLQGRLEQKRIEEIGDDILKHQLALYGKSGFTLEGSPLVVMKETYKRIKLDALMARRKGYAAATKYDKQREIYLEAGLASKWSLLDIGTIWAKAFMDMNQTALAPNKD